MDEIIKAVWALIEAILGVLFFCKCFDFIMNRVEADIIQAIVGIVFAFLCIGFVGECLEGTILAIPFSLILVVGFVYAAIEHTGGDDGDGDDDGSE